MTIYNPLNDETPAENAKEVSTSSLINDTIGICPKCKQPFGTGLVLGDEVYYCEKCRVSQPIPK